MLTLSPVANPEGTQSPITWLSRPLSEAHRISLPCTDHMARLTKKCYEPKNSRIVFSNRATTRLQISENDWLRYAYLRVCHIEKEGERANIEVSGHCFGSLKLRPGQLAGIPLPLGDHKITLEAPYKNPVSKTFTSCEENEIVRWDVSTSPGRAVATIEKVGDEIVLGHGYGALRVLTTSKNVKFTIESEAIPKRSETYKAPELFALDAGLYRVVQGGRCVYVSVEPGKEAILSLPDFASNVPIDKGCEPDSIMKKAW